MALTIGERLEDPEEQERRSIDNSSANMRVASPGVIQAFDAEKQTATVQLAIKERVGGEAMQIPQLLDVPVQFPRAGGFCMTFPVKPGDECLVIFGDMCIDAWHQSSGVQAQLETRRHDLSDGMAVLGISSVPKAVPKFSAETTQFRNEDGDAFVEIDNDKTISIKAKKLIIEMEESIFIKAPGTRAETMAALKGDCNIDGFLEAKDATYKFPEGPVRMSSHKHTGVVTGSSPSGGPQKPS